MTSYGVDNVQGIKFGYSDGGPSIFVPFKSYVLTLLLIQLCKYYRG